MPNVDVDRLACKLHEWGALARRMPPAYLGAGIAQPIRGLDERDRIGVMMPGQGLLLEHDLKSLGITRHIPGVYERTVVARSVEKLQRVRRNARRLLRDEQGTITSYDNIINARANGQAEDRTFLKTSITTVANQWSSLWQVTGNPPAGTFSATPGVATNGTTTGALSYSLSVPGGGNNKYLLTQGYTSTSAINMLMLCDILCQLGTLSATTNAAQAVSSAALTRYTTGAGVNITFEPTSAIGTTASNLTLTYTNQAGTGGQTAPAFAMTPSLIVSRLFPVATTPVTQLAAGDFGVRKVTQVQLSAAMTLGVFGFSLYYPLMWIPGIVANIFTMRDSTIQIDGIQQLFVGTDSQLGCLGAFLQTNSTTSGVLVGTMQTCAG